MEDSRWLRVITVGLVLAALAVGYFLLTGRLSSNSTRVQSQASKAVSSPVPSLLPKPTVSPLQVADYSPGSSPASSPTSSPTSAYNMLASRGQDSIKTLPRTGFPNGLIVIFSVSAIISGWSLRRFPE